MKDSKPLPITPDRKWVRRWFYCLLLIHTWFDSFLIYLLFLAIINKVLVNNRSFINTFGNTVKNKRKRRCDNHFNKDKLFIRI